jgi:enterochelin esterase family protein
MPATIITERRPNHGLRASRVSAIIPGVDVVATQGAVLEAVSALPFAGGTCYAPAENAAGLFGIRRIKMNCQRLAGRIAAGVVFMALVLSWSMSAQQAAPGRAAPAPAQARAPQAPAVTSPEVLPDRRIVFRIYAPQAQAVRLVGSDIPGLGQAGQMNKAENGVWETAVGPIEPGAYRYNFNVDGLSVMDPRNPSVSESNNNAWSLLYVPGLEFMDTKDVPHGAVASVTYYSKTLKRFRRMHVYTPPGYETSTQKYPIFYLLHGAGDCDDSWTSVGRAGFILDNVIAAKKAKPMVVVMPAGHTSQTGMGRGAAPARGGVPDFNDEFVQEFLNDIMPFAELRYRVLTTRQNRAIAGLSMGGAHTLNIAIPNLDKFAYIGVYSSGIFGLVPMPGRGGAPATPPANPGPSWEERNKAQLDNPAFKKGLKLFWFATGTDDFLIGTTRATVDLFKKYGFTPVLKESPGAHTWINWRNYLNEFALQLFQ